MKIFIVILCLIVSAAGKTENLRSGVNFTLSDTSRPVSKEINEISFFNYVELLRKQLNLPSLSDGYDGVQIRIWESWMASMSVTVISRHQSKWEASYYDFEVGPASDTDYYMAKIVTQKMKPVSPKSGWPLFSQRLVESRLMTFPDDSKLPSKGLMNDGLLYLIEISTTDEYRFYTSVSPLTRQELIPEMKFLSEILDHIRSELSAYFID